MIQKLLLQQKNIFESSISLIPSENYSFYEDYKYVLDSDINNRYSFFSNPVFTRAFPGHSCVQEIEKYVTEKLASLYKVQYVNISPLSGMNALEIFFMAMGEIGDAIAIISPRNGGHISTEKIAKNLGYKIIYIPFLADNTVDYKNLEILCDDNNIKFIYIDQMNGVTPISFSPLNHLSIVRYYDISHNAAFIASGYHKNPLEDGYNCFGGSTHKSFPGPQKAFFATNDEQIHNRISSKALSSISNNHIGNIAFLGITLERMENHWGNYVNGIVSNNTYFAKKLKEMGALILGDNPNYSNNHQLFFYFEKDNELIYKTLGEIGIYVNLLPLPFTDERIVGFRTGVQEFTFLGGTIQELDIILGIIRNVLSGKVDMSVSQDKVRELKVNLLNKFKTLYD